jgi:hypothetical protein
LHNSFIEKHPSQIRSTALFGFFYSTSFKVPKVPKVSKRNEIKALEVGTLKGTLGTSLTFPKGSLSKGFSKIRVSNRQVSGCRHHWV